MTYMIVEEATEAIECFTDSMQEAIQEAKQRRGKYLVVENTEEATIVFDSQPGVTYKF